MKTIIVLLFVGAAVFFLKAMDKAPSAEQMDDVQYCAMVYAHKHDASTGWPDFHHRYAQQCTADGQLNEAYAHGY